MNMETEEEKKQIAEEQRTLKHFIFNKLYEYQSRGEFFNDAYILFNHFDTPLKNDVMYKRAIYRKTKSLSEECMENKTWLGKLLDDDPKDKFDKHSKAVFVNEYFKTFIENLSQEEFFDYFETIIN